MWNTTKQSNKKLKYKSMSTKGKRFDHELESILDETLKNPSKILRNTTMVDLPEKMVSPGNIP